MSQPQPLCLLPPSPPAGCCDLPPPLPAAPIQPENSPGLTAIRYRIGTFTTFRRAMLDELAHVGPANPFANWREGTDGDYQTMFVELWAYLAHVLTFYQQRIANEAFLPTATQRDSLLRLAQLIDYHAGPGAGASALLAFTAEKGKTATIPAGFRVGSKAAAGKPAAVFETEAALTALGSYSAMPLSVVAPTNQFGPLGDYVAVAAPNIRAANEVAVASANFFGSAGQVYLDTYLSNPTLQNVALAPSPGVDSAVTQFSSPISFVNRAVESMSKRPVVLKGTNTRLAVGDYVLIVENQGQQTTERHLLQIATVQPDKPTNTTIITLAEPPGASYQNVTLYALRVTAGAFGNNAPAWNILSSVLTDTGKPYHDKNWDDSGNSWHFLPAPDSSNNLFLDSVYSDAKGTPQNPGWVVLLASDGSSVILQFTDARPVGRTAYTLSAKVTQLTLGSGESIKSMTFPLRSTVVLTGSEPLELENNLPLPEPLAGNKLVLAGLYPLLQKGQMVVLRGNLFDVDAQQATETVNAELAILAEKPVLDAVNNLTTVTLQKPLTQLYARAGAVLLANVVSATQGETVRDEVLGSGDGSAFQSFPLKKKPLTYLPATDAEGLVGVQSTLLVTVNGVRWDEKPTLLESAPDDQDFTTTLENTGQTTVLCGDGVFAARPSSGRDNVHARYRNGLGTSGNVAADGIAQLIDSAPGLQKVTNPLPSIGGADPESPDQIRTNAPASLRTFGRAVSTADYAALALNYPGVAKASAAWVLRDAQTLQALSQPYVQLTAVAANRLPLAQQPADFLRKLRNFLDRRRDPNVPLRIVDFTPIYIDVAVAVTVDDRFPRQGTLARVQAALNPGVNPDGQPGYFAFERLVFGESIHLSDVYAAIQAVPGVRDATVTTLRRLDQDHDPTTVRNDIFVRPTELAVIGNDPGDRSKGFLTITWRDGGFVDT